MVNKDDELKVWHELRQDVSILLGTISDRRDMLATVPWEDMPEFDRLEGLASDALDYIDGRLQELDAGYSESRTMGLYRRQAKLAREYGINYVPFQGMSTVEVPEVLAFIKQEGLASMNYERTCKAKEKYYRHMLNYPYGG